MVGFSIVITVLKLYTTPTPKYIKNTKTRQDASTYISLMKSSNPVIECHGIAFHYRRTRKFDRRRGAQSHKQKVVTLNKTAQLHYNRCEDKSDNVSDASYQSKLVRLKSKFIWLKGDQQIQDNWNSTVENLTKEVHAKDKFHECNDNSHITGFLEK